MTRLGISSMTALGLVAGALFAAPAAGAAKPATHVEPAQRIAHLKVEGTNGWHLQITSFLESGEKGRQSLAVYARGPHHQKIEYLGIKGRATTDGRIKWKVPGLGRVDVRFEETSEQPVQTIPQDGCTVEGRSANETGVFRGRIEFHGKGDYTTVKRASGRGEILVGPREVCPRKSHQRAPERSSAKSTGFKNLDAGQDLPGGGELSFSVFKASFGRRFGSINDFSASYSHRWHGLTIVARTEITDDEGGFTLTGAGGTPTEARVEPPAPFSGSGTFKLETPTTASWTGDLEVELPGLGTVGLAEPGWWAGACEVTCTKTFPPGYQVGFFTASRLP